MNNKEKIINAATELFHENGVLNTSVDSILEKSGVKKSNFYYHFKSKMQLALTVLERRILNFESEIIKETIANNLLSPLERIISLYENLSAFHINLGYKRGCPFGNIAVEMSDHDEFFRDKIAKFFKKWKDEIENSINDGVIDGSFRKEIDPSSMAMIILSHIEGAIIMVKTHKSIAPLDNGGKTIVDLIKN